MIIVIVIISIINYNNPHLLKVVVDPSEQELLMGELEDVGEGLARQAEQNQSVAVNGLPMMVVMMMMMTTTTKMMRLLSHESLVRIFRRKKSPLARCSKMRGRGRGCGKCSYVAL